MERTRTKNANSKEYIRSKGNIGDPGHLFYFLSSLCLSLLGEWKDNDSSHPWMRPIQSLVWIKNWEDNFSLSAMKRLPWCCCYNSSYSCSVFFPVLNIRLSGQYPWSMSYNNGAQPSSMWGWSMGVILRTSPIQPCALWVHKRLDYTVKERYM